MLLQCLIFTSTFATCLLYLCSSKQSNERSSRKDRINYTASTKKKGGGEEGRGIFWLQDKDIKHSHLRATKAIWIFQFWEAEFFIWKRLSSAKRKSPQMKLSLEKNTVLSRNVSKHFGNARWEMKKNTWVREKWNWKSLWFTNLSRRSLLVTSRFT